MQTDIYNPEFVKGVFDRCSEKYIFVSTLLSFGFTERWRRECAQQLPTPETDGRICYDLMSGTGEAWPHILKAHPDTQQIFAIDISSGMYARAKTRLNEMRANKIGFKRADVFGTDLDKNNADMIVSTFGLKTFNQEQRGRLAKLTASTLKSGGTFSMIEASDPVGWVFRPFYLFHLKMVLPVFEKIFLRGATDFKMIGIYSTNFGNAQSFAQQLRAEGLDVEFRKHFFGCATSVYGRKP